MRALVTLGRIGPFHGIRRLLPYAVCVYRKFSNRLISILSFKRIP